MSQPLLLACDRAEDAFKEKRKPELAQNRVIRLGKKDSPTGQKTIKFYCFLGLTGFPIAITQSQFVTGGLSRMLSPGLAVTALLKTQIRQPARTKSATFHLTKEHRLIILILLEMFKEGAMIKQKICIV